jgi:Flp pilus assembly protein CpaB
MSQTLRNLLIAAVLALVGIVLTTSYIRDQKRDLSRGKQEIVVLVAKKDIPAGTRADKLEEGGYLERKDFLREDRPPRSLSNIKDMDKSLTNQTIYSGEALSANQFGDKNTLNPADSIKGSERLVSVAITPSGTVSELIKPEDRVDIMASGTVKLTEAQQEKMGFGEAEVNCTWVAARDVTVIQTPDSLAQEAAGEDAAAATAATSATDDAQLYVIKGSDKTVQSLLYSHAGSDDTKLVFNLRPSNGDTETALPPLCSLPDGF